MFHTITNTRVLCEFLCEAVLLCISIMQTLSSYMKLFNLSCAGFNLHSSLSSYSLDKGLCLLEYLNV